MGCHVGTWCGGRKKYAPTWVGGWWDAKVKKATAAPVPVSCPSCAALPPPSSPPPPKPTLKEREKERKNRPPSLTPPSPSTQVFFKYYPERVQTLEYFGWKWWWPSLDEGEAPEPPSPYNRYDNTAGMDLVLKLGFVDRAVLDAVEAPDWEALTKAIPESVPWREQDHGVGCESLVENRDAPSDMLAIPGRAKRRQQAKARSLAQAAAGGAGAAAAAAIAANEAAAVLESGGVGGGGVGEEEGGVPRRGRGRKVASSTTTAAAATGAGKKKAAASAGGGGGGEEGAAPKKRGRKPKSEQQG